MKAFYTSYPINQHMKRSFSEAAFNEQWLAGLKALSDPNSLLVPRFLPNMLKSVFPDQTEDRLIKIKNHLFHMDEVSALVKFKEEKDYISWDILTRFIKWKQENLSEIIARGELYWDVLKGSRNNVISYPPIVHEFIHLARVKSKDLAKQLVILPIPINTRELFFMLIFKFYYNHDIKTNCKKDPYTFVSEGKGDDKRFLIIQKVVRKMFEFIQLIENTGFLIVSRYKESEKKLSSSDLFTKFQSWADILELSVKTYLFLPIVKYYIFFHFIRGDDYTNGMRLEINW
jgi:hypothetical protein